MPKMLEPQPEAPNVAERTHVIEVLGKAGLDPARLSPLERNYLMISLSEKMPAWKAAGKPVELEATRWVEAQLAQKLEFLKTTNASPVELRNAQADVRHVHERVLALEKSGLVATKTEKFPYGMMSRQVDELKKMGVDDPYKSTFEQRRIAGIRSMHANPFESRGGREEKAVASERRKADLALRMPMPSFKSPEERKRDALVQEQIAQLGPRKENPFTDEYRIKNLKNVQAQIMANETYRKAIKDQNSKFAANQKTAVDVIKDAMALVRNPETDIRPASSMYARAVMEYASILGMYYKDRGLGRDPKERMLAGLASEERAISIAMAERLSKRPAIAGMPNLEAEIMANGDYRAAIEDHNRRFPNKQKTPRDIINDAVAIAGGKKADVGPAGSPYAIAVAGYAAMLDASARDRKLGSTPEERILANLRSQEAGPLIAQERTKPREPAAANAHNYQFTVLDFDPNVKPATYEFSSADAISSTLLSRALDVPSIEAARSNLAALGVRGLSDRIIAQMREGIQDPFAKTRLVELKAKKDSKG